MPIKLRRFLHTHIFSLPFHAAVGIFSNGSLNILCSSFSNGTNTMLHFISPQKRSCNFSLPIDFKLHKKTAERFISFDSFSFSLYLGVKEIHQLFAFSLISRFFFIESIMASAKEFMSFSFATLREVFTVTRSFKTSINFKFSSM